ncbi:GntR family transcriptional regulator [Goodfellowiella coeruleoviolacea]|uniref:UTRA domain-containing protein n=1 Tax=Goodfellowiella coeruleoviolacea TaxID=334858 RepID=A0AAE3GH22_9PSEU|nr:UTRA domain-containing protein [Goodfellowiella coeruleoviolacea]MCP2168025.1 UTRA domain-containing protein [Goodfellowiella coeruleoviolacea]
MTGSSRWVSVSKPYVVPRPPGAGDAWSEEAARRGGQGGQRLREVAELVPPPRVAQALGLADGASAVVRRRTILFDGQPVELADSYYPAALASGTGLAEPASIPGGAVTLLAELGHVPSRASEEVSARPANGVERHLLDLADGEWVLELFRRLTTAAGTPVEVSVLTMVARGRTLGYELSID